MFMDIISKKSFNYQLNGGIVAGLKESVLKKTCRENLLAQNA